MDVENIDALEPAELDALLEHALDPQVPVEVLYAVLERIGPPEKPEQEPAQGLTQAQQVQQAQQAQVTAQAQVKSPLEAQLHAQMRPGDGAPFAPGPQNSGAAKHGFARPGQSAFGIGRTAPARSQERPAAPDARANAAAHPAPDTEATTAMNTVMNTVMRPEADAEATTVMRPVPDTEATALMRPVADTEATTVMRPVTDADTTTVPPTAPGQPQPLPQPQHQQPVTPAPASPPARGAATDRAVRPERPARPKDAADPNL